MSDNEGPPADFIANILSILRAEAANNPSGAAARIVSFRRTRVAKLLWEQEARVLTCIEVIGQLDSLILAHPFLCRFSNF